MSSNNNIGIIVNISSKPRFVQHPGKLNDYYIVMDGTVDMLEVYHTKNWLLGDNNRDYTISFAFLQPVETATFDFTR